MLRRLGMVAALLGLLGAAGGATTRSVLPPPPPFRSLTDPVAPDPRAVSHAPHVDRAGLLRLCDEDPGVPIVHLTPADADSIGATFSMFNLALFAHMDSLLQAGRWGPPNSREAVRSAHLMSRLMAIHSLHYMVGMATAPDRVYEASEETLRDAFKKYSDPGVYPIARMVRGRMGLGMVCVRYDLSEDLETSTTVGAQTFRIRVQETELEGQRRRMLIMDVPTILFSTVEVLIAEHFTAKAELLHSQGPPAPYDLYLFHSIEGMYVRKWGVHKPSAIMFWANPRDMSREDLPPLPLVGSCIYIPSVQLDLPSILPSVGFEDLRVVDLPQPIVALKYLEAKLYPSWIERGKVRSFKNWETYGPIPPDLRIRFPDQ